MAVYVRPETLERAARHIEYIFSVLIEYDVKVIIQGIAVGLKNTADPVSLTVQAEGFLTVGRVRAGIFDREGVGKLVRRKHDPVPVIDNAARSLQCPRLGRLETEILAVSRSVYDLQIIQSVDQDERKDAEQDREGARAADLCVFKQTF